MDLLKLDMDEADEDELFFEEPDPLPEPAAAAPKRGGRAKRAAADAVVLDLAPPPPAAMAATAAADPPPAPSIEAIGQPVVMPSRMPAIAMGLAALAALFSSVGLLVTARMSGALGEARHEVARQHAAMEKLPGLVEKVAALVDREQAELARAATQRPPEVATKADLARELDELRFGLSKMQAPGTSALAGVVRAGQQELADRIDDVADRVDAIEARRTGH